MGHLHDIDPIRGLAAIQLLLAQQCLMLSNEYWVRLTWAVLADDWVNITTQLATNIGPILAQ